MGFLRSGRDPSGYPRQQNGDQQAACPGCASGKRPLASRRALAFATRRPGGGDGSTQKFETGRPIPAAPRKIGWPERLGGGACRDDLSLVQIDFKANTSETLDKGGEETMHGKGGPCTQPIVEEESAEIVAIGVGIHGDTPCLLDDKVDSQSEECRTQGVTLLDTPYTSDESP